VVDAAIGLRPHTGWAALVVLGGEPTVVVERRRLDLRAPGIPDQLYHVAAGLTLTDAERLVAKTVAAVNELAVRALRDAVDSHHAQGRRVAGCAVLGALRQTPALPAILGSHPRIHAAEGDLFRGALAGAARALGIELLEVADRTIAADLARALRLTAPAIEGRVAELGRGAGPPWRVDQKLAAMAALLVLARSGEHRRAPVKSRR
jgi:hypothetical protein